MDGKQGNMKLHWKVSPVPNNIERAVEDIVCRPGEYGKLDDDEYNEVVSILESVPMSIQQAISLRGQLNMQKAAFNHRKLQAKARRMLKLFQKQKESILSLSKRFDFPPVNLFRAILEAGGWFKEKIKETLKDPTKFKSERYLREYLAASAADCVSGANQAREQHAAELFEKAVRDYFASIGVRFKTEMEVKNEQKASQGFVSATPDLLLLDDVEINGVKISWIDAKCFYGANVKFTARNTQTQVDKYVKRWGPGALVYRHGFCDGLNLCGVVLLDAGPIDLTELNEFTQNKDQ